MLIKHVRFQLLLDTMNIISIKHKNDLKSALKEVKFFCTNSKLSDIKSSYHNCMDNLNFLLQYFFGLNGFKIKSNLEIKNQYKPFLNKIFQHKSAFLQ